MCNIEQNQLFTQTALHLSMKECKEDYDEDNDMLQVNSASYPQQGGK